MLKVVDKPEIHTELPTKVWNKSFVNIMFANFMMYLGHWTIYTLIAKYADHLNATATIVGLVTSLFALTALLFKLISAPAIDTYNRKHIIIAAMFVLAISYFGYGISNSIGVLMAFRLLQGTGQAFTATCFLALASDALPPEKMGTGIGSFALSQAICQAVGPTIGLFLLDKVGYQNVFFIGSGMMLLAIIAAFRLDVKFCRTRAFHFSLNSIIAKEAIFPALIIFFTATTTIAINSFLVLYAGKIDVDNIGYFFTVNAITMIVFRPIIGRLFDNYGLVKIVLPGIVLMAISFYMISLADSLPILLIASFIGAIGAGGTTPAVQAAAMRSVPSDRRGAASSTCFVGSDLGILVGAPLAGILVQYGGYETMWQLITIPLFISFGIVFIAREKFT